MHPEGSTALVIARRMQDELGIDRKDIIAQLEYEPAKVGARAPPWTAVASTRADCG